MEDVRRIPGNRAQQFARRHQDFLRYWADGLHELEIGRMMGLSPAQLARHSLKAFSEQAPRVKPGYDCLVWSELPDVLKRAMPCSDETSLVKVYSTGDGLVLELLLQKSDAVTA